MAAADLVTGVVIVRERCAKTDPPPTFSDLVWTDQGPARYGWDDESPWQDHEGYELKPSVWYDLRPSEGEPLTVEHLRELGEGFNALIADDDAAVAHWSPALARLRAAIDAIGDDT